MNNIRTRRRILGLTMKQLANIVGVTEAAISHYETGRREPDNDMLLRIANALEVTVDYLIGHEDSPAPVPTQEKAHAADPLTEQIMAKARTMNEEELRQLLRIMDAVKK